MLGRRFKRKSKGNVLGRRVKWKGKGSVLGRRFKWEGKSSVLRIRARVSSGRERVACLAGV